MKPAKSLIARENAKKGDIVSGVMTKKEIEEYNKPPEIHMLKDEYEMIEDEDKWIFKPLS